MNTKVRAQVAGRYSACGPKVFMICSLSPNYFYPLEADTRPHSVKHVMLAGPTSASHHAPLLTCVPSKPHSIRYKMLALITIYLDIM